MNLKVSYRKKFIKDLVLLPAKKKLQIEQLAFNQIFLFSRIEDVPNLVRLRGEKFQFKISVGDYRIGITITDKVFIFERVMHRKEFYRYFP